jgi:hypothetical protein
MSQIINAFHPDYIKTYHPEFMTSMRIASAQHAQGVINGGKSVAEKKRKLIAVTEFYTFSKAGAANVTPKGKKKAK